MNYNKTNMNELKKKIIIATPGSGLSGVDVDKLIDKKLAIFSSDKIPRRMKIF